MDVSSLPERERALRNRGRDQVEPSNETKRHDQPSKTRNVEGYIELHSSRAPTAVSQFSKPSNQAGAKFSDNLSSERQL